MLRDDMNDVAALGKVEDAGKVIRVPTAVEVGGVGEWESAALERRCSVRREKGDSASCQNTGNQ